MRPNFTIKMTIQDNLTGETWHRAFDCDEALSISARTVQDVKSGPMLSGINFNQTVEILKTRQMRRDVLIETGKRLATALADTLEDSEGWHDASRIEPARAALKRHGRD